jgi:hypothetical protein
MEYGNVIDLSLCNKSGDKHNSRLYVIIGNQNTMSVHGGGP